MAIKIKEHETIEELNKEIRESVDGRYQALKNIKITDRKEGNPKYDTKISRRKAGYSYKSNKP